MNQDLKDIKTTNNRYKVIKLYLVPLIATLVFFIVILFLVFPKISEIFVGIDEISTINLTIENNKKKIEDLNKLTLSYNDIVSKIDVINNIAPVGTTEVVKFRDKITDLIIKNQLSVLNQRLTEIDPLTTSITDENQSLTGILLQEVPFIFGVEGSYQNIVNFVNELNSVEDFIVVKEMKLGSLANSTNIWQLSLNLVKYQFIIAENSTVDSVFKSVPIDASLSKIMEEYIQKRLSSKL